MNSKSEKLVIMAITATLGLLGAFWLFDPSDGVLKSFLMYILFAGVGLLGLVVLYGLFLLVRVIWTKMMYGIRDHGKDDPLDFFDR